MSERCWLRSSRCWRWPAVIGRYSYSAFGQIVGHSGADSPYTFTGREYDSATGLYDYRARWYEPASGRFLSEDPLPSTQNYGYVVGNPVSLVDPTGAMSISEQSEAEGLAAEQSKVSVGPIGQIRTAQQIKKEQEALSKINPNDVHHLFVKTEHGLSSVAEVLGSETEVARQLVSAVSRRGLADGFYKTVVPLAGRTVVVSGRIIDGVVRLGTAYIPAGFGS